MLQEGLEGPPRHLVPRRGRVRSGWSPLSRMWPFLAARRPGDPVSLRGADPIGKAVRFGRPLQGSERTRARVRTPEPVSRSLEEGDPLKKRLPRRCARCGKTGGVRSYPTSLKGRISVSGATPDLHPRCAEEIRASFDRYYNALINRTSERPPDSTAPPASAACTGSPRRSPTG